MNRIFVDCHGFDQGGQGTVTYIKNLYRPIISKNHDIDFYFGACNISAIEEIFGNEENVHYIKYATHNKYIRLLFVIPFIEIKYKLSYAHFQYYLPLINFCKTIVTIHDVLFLDYPQFFSKKYIRKNRFLFHLSSMIATCLLTVSEYSKNRIRHHFHPKKNIVVIPNCIDETNNQINEVIKKEEFILFVSRIEKRKNHINLCKAFLNSSLKDKTNLYIVGRKDEGSNDFFKYIDVLPEEDKRKIKILDNVNDKELVRLYKQAKLFVFPSFCEGFGIPPLEALCYNVSTICANNTGMSDYEFFGDRFFEAGNIVELQEKMEKYYDNSNGIDDIKRKMFEKYSIQNVSENFSNYITSLFKDRV